MKIVSLLILMMVIFFGVAATLGLAEETPLATRYSVGGIVGRTYSPNNDIDFAQVTAAALFDYDRIWPHRAPKPLWFKVEGAVGAAIAPRGRALISANMLALYFLEGVASDLLRPYVEAGIGLVYTDFQVDGQGLRVNFNPQAGIGTEVKWGDGPPWYAAIRLHHISNGGLHHDNRGINSVVLQVGHFF